MRIAITGGAGFLGQKLAQRLARDGALGGREIASLVLHDIVPPALPQHAPFPIECRAGDLPEAGEIASLVEARPDVIFHLAAVVSGEAELAFEKGYRINLDGTWRLLEAVRGAARESATLPRLVFASSIAVYGAPFPDAIPDELHLTPLTSYGTQKAIGELLIADYTRKGFVDGVGIRLPTISVRPGQPNRAASGFFSSICREPLAGAEAVLPVGEEVRHTLASPRAAVGYLLRAATLPGDALGPRRSLAMPGLSLTVAGMIEALARVGGERVVRRIRRERDPFIERIVAGWPERIEATRALSLGFVPDRSFDEILCAHIEDELGGTIG